MAVSFRYIFTNGQGGCHWNHKGQEGLWRGVPVETLPVYEVAGLGVNHVAKVNHHGVGCPAGKCCRWQRSRRWLKSVPQVAKFDAPAGGVVKRNITALWAARLSLL